MPKREETNGEVETRFSRGLSLTPEFEEAWNKQAARRALGRRLEKLRRESGLTQTALAELMGKDQAFVARMESGRGDMPKAENVALFAKHCGYLTAYAFVAPNDALTLHELQPIGQNEETASMFEQVHDVTLIER